MLTSVVGVIVLLGGLIFFHELGHYLVAKFFGVKVEVFSLGFGKKLFRKKVGETEYTISLFPLGGYVKLMGDDPFKGVPADEAPRAFSTQKLYKRFLIVAAGPTFNLLLAFVLFLVVFWSGLPTPSTRIGEVMVASPAWNAGLRAGDRIDSIDGKALRTWNEMEEFLKPRVGEQARVSVTRDGKSQTLTVPVSRVTEKNPYGEDEEVGGIKGISEYPIAAMVGISEPKSPAYEAGLRTGDLITKIDGKTIDIYADLNHVLSAVWAEGKTVTFAVNRGQTAEKKGTDMTFSLKLPALSEGKGGPLGVGEVLGLYPSELFVKQVSPDSPALRGGLKAGDRIVNVDGTPIFNFDTIVDAVQKAGKENVAAKFKLDRDGQSVVLDLKPVETTSKDPLTQMPVKKFLVGFVPNTAYHEADLTKLTIHEPVALVAKSAEETITLAKRMVVSLAKLAAGRISVKNLGGPVLIASVAGKSLNAGIIPFLQMMALISINLFLLNLFPVPILDGGHLFFFLIEAVKGKPVSLRTMEIATQVGMVFILSLVALTLFNDISRIVTH